VLLEELSENLVWVIHEYATPERCQELIALAEAAGFGDAPITTSFGPVLSKKHRSNTRVMIDDPALAAQLYEQGRPLLPGRVGRWEIVGFNERFRFYRYDVAERFAPHLDGAFQRDNGETSQLTFMVYLNEGFTGGETNFFDWKHELRLSVKPEIGKALVFVHQQLHEGAWVVEGRKYVLRTDVMYRRVIEEVPGR
jgi:hypothetical protein